MEEASEEDEMIGSAGNVKRDAVTLFDFIAPAKVKGGKKKGAAKPAQQAQAGKGKEKVDAAPAPAAAAAPVAAAQPAAAAAAAPAAAAQPKPAVEGKKDDPTSWRTDLVDSARQLAKRIPGNIQCVRVRCPPFFFFLFFFLFFFFLFFFLFFFSQPVIGLTCVCVCVCVCVSREGGAHLFVHGARGEGQRQAAALLLQGRGLRSLLRPLGGRQGRHLLPHHHRWCQRLNRPLL
jgi:hypothetical protein